MDSNSSDTLRQSDLWTDWTLHLRRCYSLAQRSPDPSTQNGALILDESGRQIAGGWNDFTEGVTPDDERLQRPLKYSYIEHAERFAIYNAAMTGKRLFGSTMVCAWAACVDCARAIACVGIRRLVRHHHATLRSSCYWMQSMEIADGILRDAGVQIIDIDERIGSLPVRHNGEIWYP